MGGGWGPELRMRDPSRSYGNSVGGGCGWLGVGCTAEMLGGGQLWEVRAGGAKGTC